MCSYGWPGWGGPRRADVDGVEPAQCGLVIGAGTDPRPVGHVGVVVVAHESATQ